jgi:hypothetical protein
MRIIEKRLRRAMRRVSSWVVPPEAADLYRSRRRTALVTVGALLLYANIFMASLTLAPGAAATPNTQNWTNAFAEDRAPAVVHASSRRSRAPRPQALEATRVIEASGPAAATLQAAPADWDGALGVAPPTNIPGTPPSAIPTTAVPLATPAAASIASAPQDRIILQGEFAVLLIQTLQLRAPYGGWSPMKATAALMTLQLRPELPIGLLPAGGWRLGAPLTEGELASVLSHFGLRVVSKESSRQLTTRETESVLGKLSSLFRTISPASYAGAAPPAALQLGNPRARPASPFLP